MGRAERLGELRMSHAYSVGRVHYRGCFRVSAQLTMTFLTVCPHLAHSTVAPGNFLDHLWAQHLLLYRC